MKPFFAALMMLSASALAQQKNPLSKGFASDRYQVEVPNEFAGRPMLGCAQITRLVQSSRPVITMTVELDLRSKRQDGPARPGADANQQFTFVGNTENQTLHDAYYLTTLDRSNLSEVVIPDFRSLMGAKDKSYAIVNPEITNLEWHRNNGTFNLKLSLNDSCSTR